MTGLISEGNGTVTIIACGEREKQPEPYGDLRPAIEDWLGAGAIVSRLKVTKSPEARLCEAAFLGSALVIEDLIWDCVSGRELREAGYEADVRFASGLDTIDVVPILRDGAFVKL